jgi:SWI/SNF-related matrix-associated actin-dependent regulator 1 of chromatin subfamily A
VFLTGTPIVNRPVEAWPIVATLDPTGLGQNFWRYAFRYCGATRGRYGIDTSGASNLDELQGELRSRVMVRRLKADVLKELPPKTRQVITLESTDGKIVKAIKQEHATFERAQAFIEQARVELELAKAEGKDAYRAAVERLRDASRVAFTEVSLARHDVAVAKIPAMIEAVKDAADSHPVVVMAHHKDVVAGLQKPLEEAGLRVVVVTGDVALSKRQEAVDAFQSGEADVFIGTIRAAGVGLTLTRAAHVIFAELDWVPGNVSQAEDRCHRIGQDDNVLVQHYVLDGSLDARMAKTLIAKQEILDKALDRAVDVEMIDLDALPPLPAEEEAATSELRQGEVERIAQQLDPAVAQAAHEALQLLAAMDTDRAAVINGVGFNKLDGRIGHTLAKLDVLTPKQAVLALRIVRKYKRQLGAEMSARLGIN